MSIATRPFILCTHSGLVPANDNPGPVYDPVLPTASTAAVFGTASRDHERRVLFFGDSLQEPDPECTPAPTAFNVYVPLH